MLPIEVYSYVSELSYSVTTIPISGLRGDNLIELSSNSPWYIGRGEDGKMSKTVLEAIDSDSALSR